MGKNTSPWKAPSDSAGNVAPMFATQDVTVMPSSTRLRVYASTPGPLVRLWLSISEEIQVAEWVCMPISLWLGGKVQGEASGPSLTSSSGAFADLAEGSLWTSGLTPPSCSDSCPLSAACCDCTWGCVSGDNHGCWCEWLGNAVAAKAATAAIVIAIAAAKVVAEGVVVARTSMLDSAAAATAIGTAA
eukprot:CAMPEP_0181445082 /NCGR_PEP_ID=MMETSP1110-20121109/25405_1 /TAXON_ID=174948 /ORGANISM="Symbiodinium sp., Strain CCMP421" /LENGTH=187 /DNA_ID=CAMNT_0023569117 /DNA_START=63 /DNA_END=628 /DNA_ORIENTATION=+